MKTKHLLLGLLTLVIALPSLAADFKYTYEGQTLTYTVIDEEAKTCKTKEGSIVAGGNSVSGSLVIPEIANGYKVVEIGQYGFASNGMLTSVTIPESVWRLGTGCFRNCRGLTSVTIPESVTCLGEGCFYNCKSLTAVTIPESVTTIGKSCFYDCTGLKSLIIPNEDSYVGAAAFAGCSLHPLVILSSRCDPHCLASLSKFSLIFCFAPITYIRDIYYITGDFLTVYGVPFNLTNYPHIGNVEFQTGEICELFKENCPELYEKYKDSKYYIKVDGVKKEINPNSKYVFNDLQPDKQYDMYFYRDEKEFRTSFRTFPVARTDKIEVGPTSIELNVALNPGDAKISETYWTYNKTKYTEKNPVLTGLKPNTQYSCDLTIKYPNGGSNTYTYNLTTPELQLDILQPKCTTSSTAILGAQTNISDYETNVGFQWKKYDAPASLKPNEAYAPVYDGMIEGYVKNLQPTSYYNVRAFYKNAEGNYTYTDWVTFDPSDFSYFEPTVRTYPVTDVKGNSATLRGYALPGSDDIISQGFEYELKGTGGSHIRTLAATTGTIIATGQVMTATLTDLPDGEYSFRAFVQTSAGFTYGDTQSFVIEGSGVNDVEIDSTETEIVGYYDINGRRYAAPQRGFNIVVYSDGSTGKLIVR